MGLKITVQQRQNPMTLEIAYRAVTVINDKAIDAWGLTAEEADQKLKDVIYSMTKMIVDKAEKKKHH